MSEAQAIFFASAGEDGFRFILPSQPDLVTGNGNYPQGGLVRHADAGHFATIVGRGGTGKSIFALQIVKTLLDDASTRRIKRPGAFYFTLESSDEELLAQANQFKWGKQLGKAVSDARRHGLHLIRVPSPVEDLTALNLLVRQRVARSLDEVSNVVSIVIDPMGGISLDHDLRSELGELKHLCDSHRTFLFLLTEDHIFERYSVIEHFSQSVTHLEHHPQQQPIRRLYIRKARNQTFCAGYHRLELVPAMGFKVFPSVQAQSAYAHDQLKRSRAEVGSNAPLFRDAGIECIRDIKAGSVVFLMGPPGTFKQYIASKFCDAVPERHALYLSFKADKDALSNQQPNRQVVELQDPRSISEPNRSNALICFRDARSPLSTPEEILSVVRETIVDANRAGWFGRAVIWGLRRLADMPNFADPNAVQFLEALVTLLCSQQITSLLVDWPDIQRPNTLPIVDLSKYILLTRPCLPYNDIKAKDPVVADSLWKPETHATPQSDHSVFPFRHASLLRVQRDEKGYHRNTGYHFFREQGQKPQWVQVESEFERSWVIGGREWEKDPGLF